MKPTWELLPIDTKDSHNCKCLICGKKFTFLGEGHFNMRLITCPCCKQQVWVPRCPKDCPSFGAPSKEGSIMFPLGQILHQWKKEEAK